jgi:hypothetical protein
MAWLPKYAATDRLMAGMTRPKKKRVTERLIRMMPTNHS